MTFLEWINCLKKWFEDSNQLELFADIDSYREAYEDGYSPKEVFDDEMYYASQETVRGL